MRRWGGPGRPGPAEPPGGTRAADVDERLETIPYTDVQTRLLAAKRELQAAAVAAERIRHADDAQAVRECASALIHQLDAAADGVVDLIAERRRRRGLRLER